MQTANLKSDITSSNRKEPEVYGLQGEQVVIIADHDNVMIVEGKDGKRFGVHIDQLTDMAISRESVPFEKDMAHVKPKKTKKIKTQTQHELFPE
ncbi:MAG: hypothetical protein QM791_06120 [Ferruginibacter sp.]